MGRIRHNHTIERHFKQMAIGQSVIRQFKNQLREEERNLERVIDTLTTTDEAIDLLVAILEFTTL